jgi:hypothetical protein
MKKLFILMTLSASFVHSMEDSLMIDRNVSSKFFNNHQQILESPSKIELPILNIKTLETLPSSPSPTLKMV